MSTPDRWPNQPPIQSSSASQQRPIPQRQTQAMFSTEHTTTPLAPGRVTGEHYPYQPVMPPFASSLYPVMDPNKNYEPKRMRISRACDQCRRKKIKCEAAGPDLSCRNCSASKMTCTFKDSAKKRGPPKGYIDILESRLKRMERILGGLANEKDNELQENEDQDPTETTSVSTSKSSPRSPLSIENNSQQYIPDYELSSISSEVRSKYIGDLSPLPYLSDLLNVGVDANYPHKKIKVRRVGQGLVLVDKDETHGKQPNINLLEQVGQLGPGESIRNMNEWIFRVSGIDRTTSDCLLRVYFAYIHPGLPVLNKSLFLQQYREQVAGYPSAPLLNAMYGASTRYIQTCKLVGNTILSEVDEHLNVPEGWSNKLFNNLMFYINGRYCPCISTVQALVLTLNHSESLDQQLASGWLLNSAAIRMSQDMGLHRSSEQWDIPDNEKETRRRVWWSVYIFDKWFSAATGRPQTILDEDCDEVYPSESASWEEVMDTPVDPLLDTTYPRFPSLDKNVAQKAKRENIPIYQLLVQQIKLSEIMGRVLQGLYTPRAKKHSAKHGCDAVVSYLDATLSEWKAALPPALQMSPTQAHPLDSRGQTPLLSMSRIMYLSYCTLLILLHRPFIEPNGEKMTRPSHLSLKICTDAATRCVDVANMLHFRDFMLTTWNFAIYPVFTAALIHIYNASNPDRSISDEAKRNLAKAANVIKRLVDATPSAAKIYRLLRRLIDSWDISVEERSKGRTDPDTDGTNMPRHTPQRTKVDQRGEDDRVTTTDVEQERTQTLSDINGDSSLTESDKPILVTSSLEAPVATTDPDLLPNGSHVSTPSSVVIGDWINGLYSSLQPDMETIHSIVDSDPFSLRQYGLLDSVNPLQVNQLENALGPIYYDPTSADMTGTGSSIPMPSFMQQADLPLDYSNIRSSMIHPTPQEKSTLTDINSLRQTPLSLSTTAHQPPGQPRLSGDPSSNITSATMSLSQQPPPQCPSFPPSQNVPSVVSTTNPSNESLHQNLFRYRPDNPFWSVPSSIELDNWAVYLSPHLGRSNSSSSSANMTVDQPPTTSASWNWIQQ